MKLACKHMQERLDDISTLPLKSGDDIEAALKQVNNILTDAAEIRINRKASRKLKRRVGKQKNKP